MEKFTELRHGIVARTEREVCGIVIFGATGPIGKIDRRDRFPARARAVND